MPKVGNHLLVVSRMARAGAVIGIWEAATKAQELLSFFRTNRQPTFLIHHISRQDNAVFFRPDSPGAEINVRIRPFADDRIIKIRN